MPPPPGRRTRGAEWLPMMVLFTFPNGSICTPRKQNVSSRPKPAYGQLSCGELCSIVAPSHILAAIVDALIASGWASTPIDPEHHGRPGQWVARANMNAATGMNEAAP